jgi:hypothetical protein
MIALVGFHPIGASEGEQIWVNPAHVVAVIPYGPNRTDVVLSGRNLIYSFELNIDYVLDHLVGTKSGEWTTRPT